MLVNVIRKLFNHIGMEDISDSDCTRFIAICKLDKLPPYLVFGIVSVYPIIEIAIRKIKKEELDWSGLAE